MPPKLEAITCRCLSIRTSLFENHAGSPQASRAFSASALHQTRLRRSMWAWLATQGRNFLDPLPGSTNYLGAYDRKGRLKRLSGNAAEDGSDKSPSTTSNQDESLLPAERSSDLVPFPQNTAFHSQRVISEELREAIWENIMKDGQSVKTVSAKLGVEMSRVGAVVRLKEIEKEWIRKVSLISF
jgi:hypothetical protein